MVEDARPGIEAGRAAGAATVGVTSTHEAAQLSAADVVIPTPEKLPAGWRALRCVRRRAGERRASRGRGATWGGEPRHSSWRQGFPRVLGSIFERCPSRTCDRRRACAGLGGDGSRRRTKFGAMIGLVAVVVASVILVFFGIGYALGRIFVSTKTCAAGRAPPLATPKRQVDLRLMSAPRRASASRTNGLEPRGQPAAAVQPGGDLLRP